MNRSLINTILADAEDFFRIQSIVLPPFAFWSPDAFKLQVNDLSCEQIVKRALGWTVTDFGLGKFTEDGLVSFTTRLSKSHHTEEWFTEKHLILRAGQSMPLHCHRGMTKDIVNRCNATLLVQMYRVSGAGDLDKAQRLEIYVDGQQRELAPGEVVALTQGESLTISEGVYYELEASGKDVIASEIGICSDSDRDILFYIPVAIQPDIVEDEPPRRLLIQDYREHFPGLITIS